MDPNAAWNDVLDWADEIVRDPENDHLTAYDIAEKVLALDEWITSGGFMPTRWGR